jgi:hypothetical protein
MKAKPTRVRNNCPRRDLPERFGKLEDARVTSSGRRHDSVAMV